MPRRKNWRRSDARRSLLHGSANKPAELAPEFKDIQRNLQHKNENKDNQTDTQKKDRNKENQTNLQNKDCKMNFT